MKNLAVPLSFQLIAFVSQLPYAENRTIEQRLFPIGPELNSAYQNLQKTAKRLSDMKLSSFEENCLSQIAVLNIEKYPLCVPMAHPFSCLATV